jgi:predicted metal-binding membrane protein
MTSTIPKKLAIPIAVIALAWWYTVAHSTMPSMRMNTQTDLSAVAAMGGIMMIAMMLPAVLPGIVVAGIRFAAGYALVWSALGATMALLLRQVGAIPEAALVPVVAIALIYEFTPLKRDFLHSCTQGMDRVSRRNAFATGLRQGILCAGCCLFLMAALFALGASNVGLMVAVTIYVVAQRLIVKGRLPAVAERVGREPIARNAR